MNAPSVYVSGVSAVLQVAERFGAPRADLLALARLQPEWLNQADERLPVARAGATGNTGQADVFWSEFGVQVGPFRSDFDCEYQRTITSDGPPVYK